MRTTILMAGLLAGLAGTALLAQTTTEEPATQAPATEVPQAEAQATAPAETAEGDMDDAAGFGTRGGRGMGVPGLAPLETYDADDDGMVTREEVGTGRAERFAVADADGDGALSPEELIAMEEAIREETRLARAAAVVTRMDDNGDGLLQAEELEARTPRIAPLFDELDTDGDGGISPAELEARRPQRGEGGFGRGHGYGERGGFMGRLFGNWRSWADPYAGRSLARRGFVAALSRNLSSKMWLGRRHGPPRSEPSPGSIRCPSDIPDEVHDAHCSFPPGPAQVRRGDGLSPGLRERAPPGAIRPR